MKTARCLILGYCLAVSFIGCQATSGVQTLLSDGEPDLIPLPAAGFCRGGTVVVTLRNRGPSDAEASTTAVTFAGGGTVQVATPSVEGGRIASLPPIAIPTACFAPDCFMQIVIDADNDVDESDESNNAVDETCSPS